MEVYRIEFNDFGELYVLGETYAEVEKKLFDSGFMGDNGNIKKITKLGKALT